MSSNDTFCTRMRERMCACVGWRKICADANEIRRAIPSMQRASHDGVTVIKTGLPREIQSAVVARELAQSNNFPSPGSASERASAIDYFAARRLEKYGNCARAGCSKYF